jgi:hypothetical protein
VPLLPLPLLVLLTIAAIVGLIPIAIVQRYRVGTSRQRARGWLTVLNIAGLTVSAVLFLIGATFTTMWVPHTLTYAAGGFVAGALLGLTGLWLTRWESSIDALHYTPNRLLVLGVMLIVTGRLIYGIWRGWHSWQAGLHGESWFVASGVPGAMAAGAVVLGYYLTYWIGVRRRLRRHAARPLRRL